MKSGYLQVSAKHQLYFETRGNDKGIPVIVVHGGPGAGLSQKDYEFFNLDKYYTILFDQRGAGKSLPSGELEENHTSELVKDMVLLLDFLMIKKVIVFGGSWGSCLSLLFAMRHPKKVLGLVLRGSFLGTLKNRVHFETGGNRDQYPAIWDRFKSLVPVAEQDDIFTYYMNKILDDDPKISGIYAYELERYGLAHSSVTITSEEVTEKLENFNGIHKSRIFAYYTKNDFFIPENYILDQVDQLPKVPIHLVHGAQDLICLPESTIELHEKIPESTMNIVPGGHSHHCTGVKKKLVDIMATW